MATLTTSWQIISADGFYDPSHYSQALEARYTSQNKESNYTDIEIRVVNYTSSASYVWRTQSGTVNFTGDYTDSGSCATYPNNVTYGQVMLSRSKRVYHNEDGTKSINLGAHLDAVIGGTTYNSNPPITNIVIPKINRISPITSFTGNDVEGNFSATYTQYVPNYTQKLKIGISGGVTLQTYDDYVSGTDVTLNASSISAIETYMNANNTNQVTLSAVIETYSGTTLIGTSSALTSVASFSNAEPTITYTEEETDAKVIAVLGTSGDTPVQNASKLKFTITPTAKHGATISSVIATHDTTYPATKVGNDYIVTIPIKTKFITISVTDNRGNFNAVVIAKSNLIEYQSVDISPNFTIKRINPTSSTIRFNLTARYYQQTFGSYTNVPHLYYKLDNNARVEIPSSAYVIDNTNHTLTLTNYDAANLLVYTSSGQFTLQLEDLLTTDEEGGSNGYVLKGIPTFEAGEHDLQVNGDLIVADTNGENAMNVENIANGFLLWKNNSPTERFLQQDIYIDNLKDYAMFDVFFQRNTTNDSVQCVRIYNNSPYVTHSYLCGGSCVFVEPGTTMYHAVRNFNLMPNVNPVCFHFYPGWLNNGQDDTRIIPRFIIGYKTNIFKSLDN